MGEYTDSNNFISWAILVTQFKYKGQVHDGMPLFESAGDVYDKLEYLDLTWKCMCNNSNKYCSKAIYTEKSHPELYEICENNLTKENYFKMSKEIDESHSYPKDVKELNELKERYRTKIELREKYVEILYEYLIKDIYVPKVLLNIVVSYI
jgi:hypothetical protein